MPAAPAVAGFAAPARVTVALHPRVAHLIRVRVRFRVRVRVRVGVRVGVRVPVSPTAEHEPCAPQDTASGPSQGLRSQRGPPHGGSHTQACLLAAEVAASYSAVGDQWRSHPRRCLWLPSGLTCHRVMRLWQVRGQCTCVTALVPHARVLAHVHASTEQPCCAGAVRTALDVLTCRHLVRVKVRARGNGRAKARVKLYAVVYP